MTATRYAALSEGKLHSTSLAARAAAAGEAAESIGVVAANLEAHQIPGCGQLVPEEAPNELAALLIPFLESARAS